MPRDAHHNGGTASPTVLTFHKLTDKLSFGSTNFSPGRFDRLLQTLLEAGFHFTSLDETIEPNGAAKAVAITFDDGYRHLLESLPPIIDKYKIAPTIFMPTDLIGKENRWDYSSIFRTEPHLERDEIRRLADLGVEFGSHAASHSDLTRLNRDDLKRELSESRERLQKIAGREVSFLSYPFGRNNRSVRAAAAEAGYKAAFTMAFPKRDDHRFALGRIPVYGFDTSFTVLKKLEPGLIYNIEKFKASLTNRLSGGTALYRKLRPLA